MEIRPLRDADLDAAFALDTDAFHRTQARREDFVQLFEAPRLVGAFEAGRLLAMSGVLPFGQYFGGRAVPMGGLASVAVVPDARGRGLARPVIHACIHAMRERGEVLSSLFPATTQLYRSLGWEHAGRMGISKLVPASLRGLPRPEGGGARPAVSGDRAAMRAAYRRFATGQNGCLERPERWWERRERRWQEHDVYVFEGAGGELEGYLAYRQIDGEYTHLGGDFALVVDELVATTRDAGLGLFGLLVSWASQVAEIQFRYSLDEAVPFLLPEQVVQTLADFRWMSRVIDACGAVAARGFAEGMDVEVPLTLRDEVVAANDGHFVLSVQKGRGVLARAPTADGPSLHVRGFSSLFTGLARCAVLARSGLLTGGTPAQHAALDLAFAGAAPWMLDEI